MAKVGRTHGDARHPHAIVARKMEMYVAFKVSVFLVAQNSYVGTSSDFEGDRRIDWVGEIVFWIEANNISDFLNSPDTSYLIWDYDKYYLPACAWWRDVCDEGGDFSLADFGKRINIEHSSDVEESPLRLRDVQYKICKDLWEDGLRLGFQGLDNLQTCFLD